MSKLKLNCILSAILCLVVTRAYAQDPVFSQFYNNAVYLNPALVGEEEDVYFNFSHRSQWRALTFPYSTYQASLIVPYYQDKHLRPQGHLGGLGVSLYTDRAGEYNNYRSVGGSASMAYNVRFAENNINRLTFALQAGFINRVIDTDHLQWGEQFSQYVGHDNTIVPEDLGSIQNKTFMDISFGSFYRYYAKSHYSSIRSFYVGLVGAHLNHPDQSVIKGQEDRLPLLYKLHGGIVYSLSRSWSISTNVLSLIQDKENQTNFGSFVSYSTPFDTKGQLSNMVVRTGAWYRVKDSMIASVEILTNHFQVGFSYDWNTTSLRFNQQGAGAYEVSMGYRFYKPAAPKVLY